MPALHAYMFDCLLMLPLRTEEVFSPANSRSTRQGLGVASLWGWSLGLPSAVRHLSKGSLVPQASACLVSSLSSIGVQIDSVVIAPASREAARLPGVCPMALGYGLPALYP